MHVTYSCLECSATTRSALDDQPSALRCDQCDHAIQLAPGSSVDQGIERCVVCSSKELFLRKDFSQRWGMTIIVLGFVASSITWAWYMPYWTFAILAATAVIDLVLYFVVGNLLQCYRCRAEYRGIPGLEQWQPFNLETHERYRQQAARLAAAVQHTNPEGADRAEP